MTAPLSTAPDAACILTINGGSSSIKFALYACDHPLHQQVLGKIERIGLPDTRLVYADAARKSRQDEAIDARDHASAAHRLIKWLEERIGFAAIRAAEAVAMFYYHARKWIGSLAAVLGGLDTLVFAGGIGENAGQVRARICNGLAFLGLTLDDARNDVHAPVISSASSAVTVRVIRTDEERMIAKATLDILRAENRDRPDAAPRETSGRRSAGVPDKGEKP
jgi:acetate kinase